MGLEGVLAVTTSMGAFEAGEGTLERSVAGGMPPCGDWQWKGGPAEGDEEVCTRNMQHMEINSAFQSLKHSH